MRTNPIQPISFNGLRIEGTIHTNNIKKLNELINNFEKNKLIADMENNFNTDVILNAQFDTVTFSHKKYGSLSNYIEPSLVENLMSGVSGLSSDIKKAITKAEKNYLSSKIIRRGC